jgi:hypothetical protein
MIKMELALLPALHFVEIADQNKSNSTNYFKRPPLNLSSSVSASFVL